MFSGEDCAGKSPFECDWSQRATHWNKSKTSTGMNINDNTRHTIHMKARVTLCNCENTSPLHLSELMMFQREWTYFATFGLFDVSVWIWCQCGNTIWCPDQSKHQCHCQFCYDCSIFSSLYSVIFIFCYSITYTYLYSITYTYFSTWHPFICGHAKYPFFAPIYWYNYKAYMQLCIPW